MQILKYLLIFHHLRLLHLVPTELHKPVATYMAHPAQILSTTQITFLHVLGNVIYSDFTTVKNNVTSLCTTHLSIAPQCTQS